MLGIAVSTADVLTANAHHNGTFANVDYSDGTQEFVPVYNSSGGGFLASVAVRVTTIIHYRDSTITNNDDIQISGETRVLKDQMIPCGGGINTRDYAVVNGANFTLVSGGAYIGDPSYQYDTKHSNLQARQKPYSISINTQGLTILMEVNALVEEV